MKKQILLIIFICSIIFVSGCTNNKSTNSTNNKSLSTNTTSSTVSSIVQIKNSTDGQTVSKLYTITGETQPLKANENLYVLIKPANYTWWVQNKPTISSDGTWQCDVQFGEDNDSNVKFTVCALITTEKLTLKKEYGANLPPNTAETEIVVTRV